MNDYDKAGRYLVKRDPEGFCRWVFDSPGLAFHAWIDSRRVALPNQNDLTNDLVAAVRSGATLEAVCLELEAEARADALTRLLAYMARLWTEPGSRASLSVACVSGVILDLTGRSAAHQLSLRSALTDQCRLELSVLRRHLADENAERLVAGVAAGETSSWLLGWVPLMQGGGDAGIIVQWRAVAERRFSNERESADLGLLALVFATLAGSRPAWDRVLRGWNMKTSPNGTPVSIHHYVENCDAAIKRAQDAGATVIMPAQDMFWGDRYGVVTDPYGHKWSFATHIKELTPDEMQAAMKDAFAQER